MFVDEVKLATGKMTVIINIPTPTYKISPPPSSTTPTKKIEVKVAFGWLMATIILKVIRQLV